jgi:CBS domain-containing protein
VMVRDVLVTSPDATAFDAAKQMASENRGSIVVLDGVVPVAIVTESDLFKKVVAKNLSAKELLVRDLMSSPLISIGPEEPLRMAARLMSEKHIRRLPVVENNRLVGILTASDLARLEPHELL